MVGFLAELRDFFQYFCRACISSKTFALRFRFRPLPSVWSDLPPQFRVSGPVCRQVLGTFTSLQGLNIFEASLEIRA